MFILLYTQNGVTCRHPLRPGDTTVGRAPICDLAIDEPSISRRHVRFRVHGDHCVLTDLGGRNGTFLNGEQVTEAEVKAGDAVVLGRFPLRVDKAAAEPLVFSDNHALIDAGLVIRSLDSRKDSAACPTVVHTERLLLLLSEVARQLVRSGPVADLLDRIVSVALETLPIDRAFLVLMDETANEAAARACRARNNRPIINASISRSIVRRVVQEKVALLGADAVIEPQHAPGQSVPPENVRSFMAAPLLLDERVLGLLYVDNPYSSQLGPADLDMLLALGSYAAVAIDQTQRAERLAEQRRLRDRFERSYAPALVERLLAETRGPANRPLPAERRDVTVLMARLVGVEDRYGSQPPAALADFLERCFLAMCPAVYATEGTIARLGGDTLVAIFGAPAEQPDHALRALRAAQQIQRALGAVDCDPPIAAVIVLHSGIATTGEIGWPKRRDYTALGDVVTTCGHILTTCPAPHGIVLGAPTVERLGDRARVHALPSLRLADGRSIELYGPE